MLVSRSLRTAEQILGEHLRELRTSAELSQEALAEKAGLHRNYVGHLERGEKNASLHVLLKLSRAFALEPSELLKCLPLRAVEKMNLDDREVR